MHSFTEYDPARANRLLDELGLTARDAEGYRLLRDGTRMTFTLNLTDYTTVGPARFWNIVMGVVLLNLGSVLPPSL